LDSEAIEMINKVNILTYSLTRTMKNEIRKRFSFMLRKSIHKDLKNKSTELEMDMSPLVEAGIKLVTEKSKVEIQNILGVVE
jgi:hypothetical protein